MIQATLLTAIPIQQAVPLVLLVTTRLLLAEKSTATADWFSMSAPNGTPGRRTTHRAQIPREIPGYRACWWDNNTATMQFGPVLRVLVNNKAAPSIRGGLFISWQTRLSTADENGIDGANFMGQIPLTVKKFADDSFVGEGVYAQADANPNPLVCK